ncbi:hypothetical protein EV182_005609, partial [Spiromyces aspiralis]
MSTLHHGFVASILSANLPLIPASTLHIYLDAVEATCRNNPNQMTQSYHVQLAAHIFTRALIDGYIDNDEFNASLTSFCLSYARVKAAIDLYALLIRTAHGGLSNSEQESEVSEDR